MTEMELKKRLILKINRIKNNRLLEEVYRLLENEDADSTIYELSAEQNRVISESQKQYKKGQIIQGHQADKDIEEWLERYSGPYKHNKIALLIIVLSIWDCRQNPDDLKRIVPARSKSK